MSEIDKHIQRAHRSINSLILTCETECEWAQDRGDKHMAEVITTQICILNSLSDLTTAVEKLASKVDS